MRFNGPDYEPELDQDRLGKQHERIRDLMMDGCWRTLHEIEEETSDPAASISAQLRHLRKPRFGSFEIDKRRRGDGEHGLWEYRLDPSSGGPCVDSPPKKTLFPPLAEKEVEPALEDLRRLYTVAGKAGLVVSPEFVKLGKWLRSLVDNGKRKEEEDDGDEQRTTREAGA